MAWELFVLQLMLIAKAVISYMIGVIFRNAYLKETYKIICGRKFGRTATLSMPNLDHFGSDEFCFESYQKNK